MREFIDDKADGNDDTKTIYDFVEQASLITLLGHGEGVLPLILLIAILTQGKLCIFLLVEMIVHNLCMFRLLFQWITHPKAIVFVKTDVESEILRIL